MKKTNIKFLYFYEILNLLNTYKQYNKYYFYVHNLYV
jgi:hypothetical protein